MTVGLALLLSSRQTPIYQSEAAVLVLPIDTGSEVLPAEEPNLATEAELVSSATVARIVRDNLGIRKSAAALLQSLDVAQPTDTEILEIRYRDPDPTTARTIAGGFAQGYLQFREDAATAEIFEQAQDLESEIAALEDQIERIELQRLRLPEDDPRQTRLATEATLLGDQLVESQLARIDLPSEVTGGEIIQPASLPTSPVSPNHIVNVVLGLIAGLALGVGQALIRDRMSGRLRSSEEVEDYIDAPVLAVIPGIPDWTRRKHAYLINLSRRQSPVSEAFRVLRTNLSSAAAATGTKSIVVTSAYSGEGKSTTVANLGLVLARADQRVSLVSADLRRPRLHEFFRIDQRGGLSDVLRGELPLDAALLAVDMPSLPSRGPSSASLRILPSGRIPADPAELLASEAMARVLAELEETSDIVLIDVPPILPVTDAPLVARVADAVLLVIGPNSCTVASVSAARQQLDRVGARIVGGVLNGVTTIEAQSYGYY